MITGPYRALRKLEDGDPVRVTTPELEERGKDKSSDNEDSAKESD